MWMILSLRDHPLHSWLSTTYSKISRFRQERDVARPLCGRASRATRPYRPSPGDRDAPSAGVTKKAAESW